ncbi:MAG: hypothetical protein ACKOQT_00220, partial [Acidimicrobiaceae bacterium]
INCANSKTHKQPLKNALYYLLNIFSIRNTQTRSVPWSQLTTEGYELINFDCRHFGNWQTVNNSTRSEIGSRNLDVIIKFGMNLLKDPQDIPSKYGVLSFHHGDPSEHRGRPSGFYELLTGANHVGAVVQQLSNKLDAGTIRSFGKYRIINHSYRQTLENLFANSASLLRLAILNCVSSVVVDISTTGENHRLPLNKTVSKFVLLLTRRKFKRLFFGLFGRRDWKIAETSMLSVETLKPLQTITPFNSITPPRETSFIADPFILPSGDLIFEAARRNSELGQLMTLNDGKLTFVNTSLIGSHRHLSFPFVVQADGKCFIMPEMAQSGAQLLCELQNNAITKTHEMIGLENERLIDSVLLNRNETWWLFAGKLGSEFDHLFAWSSSNLFAPYKPHALNPVVIDPSRARNAGGFVNFGTDLYRLGQNNCREYGDGITVCRVLQLDEDNYKEQPISRLTINESNATYLFNQWAESLCRLLQISI